MSKNTSTYIQAIRDGDRKVINSLEDSIRFSLTTQARDRLVGVRKMYAPMVVEKVYEILWRQRHSIRRRSDIVKLAQKITESVVKKINDKKVNDVPRIAWADIPKAQDTFAKLTKTESQKKEAKLRQGFLEAVMDSHIALALFFRKRLGKSHAEMSKIIDSITPEGTHKSQAFRGRDELEWRIQHSMELAIEKTIAPVKKLRRKHQTVKNEAKRKHRKSALIGTGVVAVGTGAVVARRRRKRKRRKRESERN